MTKKLLFRLPNWLGDVCMALPIIRAIQEQNPNTHYTFLSQSHYIPLLNALGIEGETIALPEKNWRYYIHCLKLRNRYDEQVLFTNSERGDIEAFLIGSKKRYGITRVGKPRKLITHSYHISEEFDEEALHQTFLWRDFTASFNLHDGINLSPCYPISDKRTSAIGLICGSANTPEKRWPIDYWKALINSLLEKGVERILLIGSSADKAVCNEIKSNFDDIKVENWTAQTTLATLLELIRGLDLVIGNDTGGLHIANALGVPVIGLYGYTNPVRCHPIHDAPLTILTSPKGYVDGVMSDISVNDVLEAASHFISKP